MNGLLESLRRALVETADSHRVSKYSNATDSSTIGSVELSHKNKHSYEQLHNEFGSSFDNVRYVVENRGPYAVYGELQYWCLSSLVDVMLSCFYQASKIDTNSLCHISAWVDLLQDHFEPIRSKSCNSDDSTDDAITMTS
ncbi:hypothetical protein Tco_1255162 [Tanacetum coccineum]